MLSIPDVTSHKFLIAPTIHSRTFRPDSNRAKHICCTCTYNSVSLTEHLKMGHSRFEHCTKCTNAFSFDCFLLTTTDKARWCTVRETLSTRNNEREKKERTRPMQFTNELYCSIFIILKNKEVHRTKVTFPFHWRALKVNQYKNPCNLQISILGHFYFVLHFCLY